MHPEASRLARAWLDQGRFPSEVRVLPRGERAFMWAAYLVQDEEYEKHKPK